MCACGMGLPDAEIWPIWLSSGERVAEEGSGTSRDAELQGFRNPFFGPCGSSGPWDPHLFQCH